MVQGKEQQQQQRGADRRAAAPACHPFDRLAGPRQAVQRGHGLISVSRSPSPSYIHYTDGKAGHSRRHTYPWPSLASQTPMRQSGGGTLHPPRPQRVNRWRAPPPTPRPSSRSSRCHPSSSGCGDGRRPPRQEYGVRTRALPLSDSPPSSPRPTLFLSSPETGDTRPLDWPKLGKS